MRRLAWLGAACVAALFAACSATGGNSHPGSGSGGSGGTAGTGTGAGGVGNAPGSGGQPPGDASTLDVNNSDSGGGPPVGDVYGHSNTTLYKLDPYSKQISIVGNFNCLGNAAALGGGMWDIAIDKAGHMVGSMNNGLGTGAMVTIDKTTAHCSVVKTGNYPNSLTYLPAGTLLPNSEALVGYDRDAYVQISTQNASVTTIGNLNPNVTGQNWESSGDIVSIIGAKTYLTVKPYGSNGGTDSIVEVDPKTGKIIKMIGNTGFTELWGLGYWAGVAYGFSATGQLAQIDLTTGQGTAIPLKNVPANLSFWGAGVTTAAPIKPPQ